MDALQIGYNRDPEDEIVNYREVRLVWNEGKKRENFLIFYTDSEWDRLKELTVLYTDAIALKKYKNSKPCSHEINRSDVASTISLCAHISREFGLKLRCAKAVAEWMIEEVIFDYDHPRREQACTTESYLLSSKKNYVYEDESLLYDKHCSKVAAENNRMLTEACRAADLQS